MLRDRVYDLTGEIVSKEKFGAKLTAIPRGYPTAELSGPPSISRTHIYINR
jgi:hypothetical protein